MRMVDTVSARANRANRAMTEPRRPVLVRAVCVTSARQVRELLPQCLRHTKALPLPLADPPAWVLPGGDIVGEARAQRVAMRMGWGLE